MGCSQEEGGSFNKKKERVATQAGFRKKAWVWSNVQKKERGRKVKTKRFQTMFEDFF